MMRKMIVVVVVSSWPWLACSASATGSQRPTGERWTVRPLRQADWRPAGLDGPSWLQRTGPECWQSDCRCPAAVGSGSAAAVTNSSDSATSSTRCSETSRDFGSLGLWVFYLFV